MVTCAQMPAFALALLLGFPAGFVHSQESAAAAVSTGSADEDFGDFEDEFASATGENRKVFDPLRGYNRFMFKFNDKFYYWLLRPTAKGYRKVMPQPARTLVSRAFHNLHFPLRFVNNVLQLKFKGAGIELGRFLVNSTAGVGGLFDPADKWLKMRPHEEDFGQTLGRYGVGDGFPIVLPLLGQTNLRDGLGMVPNYLVYPVTYLADFEANFGVAAGEKFNYVSLHMDEYESIKADALDPYVFIRDAYKQNRDKEIRE